MPVTHLTLEDLRKVDMVDTLDDVEPPYRSGDSDRVERAPKWPSVEDATRRVKLLIGDQFETDIAARDLIVLMRELGRVTAEGNHLKYERQEIIDNALEELKEATRAENEACAALAERNPFAHALDIAFAIRARIAPEDNSHE